MNILYTQLIGLAPWNLKGHWNVGWQSGSYINENSCNTRSKKSLKNNVSSVTSIPVVNLHADKQQMQEPVDASNCTANAKCEKSQTSFFFFFQKNDSLSKVISLEMNLMPPLPVNKHPHLERACCITKSTLAWDKHFEQNTVTPYFQNGGLLERL